MKKIVITACIIIAVTVIGIFLIRSYDSENKTNITVGLVLNGSIADKNWGQSHYEGIVEATQELGANLIYSEYNTAESVSATVDEFVENGCSIIILNSFGFGENLAEITAKYPDVYFFHATGVENYENAATYFGRMYQMRYLCGIVAGLQTETNNIGYVAAFPISEVNRGINAFTLGVRAVNPNACVYVNWTNSWIDDEAASAATLDLIENRNVDVITMHVDSLRPHKVADDNNIFSIGYNIDNCESYPDTYLTAAVWNWENFYVPRITECVEGSFEGRNYWEGVDTGIISLAPFGKSAKDGISEKVDSERQRLQSGTFDVFYGPIYDNEGNLRIAEGESMSDQSMLNSFDWYVEGVVINE